MPGYFTVTLTLAKGREIEKEKSDVRPARADGPRVAANFDVEVLVEAFANFKGTVALANSHDGDVPLYVDPTSDSLFIPLNGSATTLVSVGLSSGQSTVLWGEAALTPNSDTDSIELEAP